MEMKARERKAGPQDGKMCDVTYRAVFPKDHDSLEDEEVRDPDRGDGEHCACEYEPLASAARSAVPRHALSCAD